MSIRSRPATASIAALPVSPLVAPTIVRRSSRRERNSSNSRPRSCSATSLNASVGPVEQLEQPVALVELGQRGHGDVGEAAVCLLAQLKQAPGRKAVADEGLHDPRGELGIGQPAHCGDLVER